MAPPVGMVGTHISTQMFMYNVTVCSSSRLYSAAHVQKLHMSKTVHLKQPLKVLIQDFDQPSTALDFPLLDLSFCQYFGMRRSMVRPPQWSQQTGVVGNANQDIAVLLHFGSSTRVGDMLGVLREVRWQVGVVEVAKSITSAWTFSGDGYISFSRWRHVNKRQPKIQR